MKRLDLQKCIVGSVFTNCYFLKNKETEEMLIVDPGDNADRIEQKVLEMQGRPVAILRTHGHFDPAGSKNQSDSISHEQLYIEGGCLSYGSSGCGTGRFFGSDDRDSRTYVRKLLLLFER